MLEPVAAFSKAAELGSKIGLWEKVLARLVGRPEAAATHLGIALTEVRKTFGSLQTSILEISYLGIPGQDQVDVMRALDRIEMGQLSEAVASGQGSCHRIANIYDKHLKAWLPTVLKPNEQRAIAEIFEELRDADLWAVGAAEGLLNVARPFAATLRLQLRNGSEAEAKTEVDAFLRQFRPTLKEIQSAVTTMVRLESTFILQKGIV